MRNNKFSLPKLLAGTLAFATALTASPIASVIANAEETEEDKYITMNVPYDVFYGSYMTVKTSTAEGSDLNVAVDVDTDNDSKYDAVTSATTNKFKGTTGLAKGTWNDGSQICGVAIPVKVSAEDYELLKENKVDADTKAYYYTDLEEAPDYYSTLDVTESGDSLTYDFSAIAASSYTSEYLSIGDVTYTGGYGDVQFSLGGFGTGKNKDTEGIKVGESTYVSYVIYGVVVTTEAGGEYGMTTLENIWNGAKSENPEIAYSVPDGQGIKKNHGHSDKTFCQLTDSAAELDGAKLASVKVITNQGVFTINSDLQLDDYISGASFTAAVDGTTLSISGLPSAMAVNGTTVSVTGGDSDLALTFDGGVGTATLSSALADGKQYTVTLKATGYGPVFSTVSTMMTADQCKELAKWMSAGWKVVNEQGVVDDTATLVSKLHDASNMIQDRAATNSYDAANEITALKALVKSFYSEVTTSATLVGNTLTIDFGSVDFASLVNPTYSLSYAAGRGSSYLVNGAELTGSTVNLTTAPTLKTSYTLTIVSDNYQDITVSGVVAYGQTTVTLKNKTVTYNGKAAAIDAAVVSGSTGDVTYTYYSDSACKKEIAAPTNAGTYYVKASVAADDSYVAAVSDAAKLVINKATPTVKVSTTSKSYTTATLKKAAQTFAIGASVTGNGKMTYTKSSGSSVLSINKTTGKVTVKKGTAKGTYSIKVKVAAAASTNYAAASKTVTIKVTVK